MSEAIGVDCTFNIDGQVRVRRIQVDDRWHVVDPGRQWLDEAGRHVLIMIPGGRVFEILLSFKTLTWSLVSVRAKTNII